MDGEFVVSSGRMRGSYKERKYTYEVLQVELVNGTTIGEKDRKKIDVEDLRNSHMILFKIKGGHLKDEDQYRYVYGPYESQADMEAAITDMMLYGSP